MDKKSLKIETNILTEEKILHWEKILEKLKESMGLQIYTSWLKNIKLLKEYNHFVVLGVQTRFFRDWITSRYADKILDEITSILIRHQSKDSKIMFASNFFFYY